MSEAYNRLTENYKRFLSLNQANHKYIQFKGLIEIFNPELTTIDKNKVENYIFDLKEDSKNFKILLDSTNISKAAFLVAVNRRIKELQIING